MKRKDFIDKRPTAYLENVRFFQYMPEEIRRTLSVEQRRAIAKTILELQRSNPRILQEIYMEHPGPDEELPKGMWMRVWRRVSLVLSWLWLGMVLQRNERRREASLADYLFLVIVAVMILALLIFILLLLYGVKNMIGIDIFPGIHFLYVG